MKTIPTEVKYSGTQFIKLQEEFKAKEEELEVAKENVERLRMTLQLIGNHHKIDLKLDLPDRGLPKYAEVDMGMGGIQIRVN
jgi:hypothetical protein